jgi:hypothetical protein
MSQVIYARVPETVKADVEEYASKEGVTLSSATVDLLQRGLASIGEERSVANLETTVAKLAVENSVLSSKVEVATNELGGLRSLADRASSTVVGTCPSCGASISGLDLLGQGRCGKCRDSLLELLAPKSQSAKPFLDDRAVGALIGALGVVLIAGALMGTKGQ